MLTLETVYDVTNRLVVMVRGETAHTSLSAEVHTWMRIN